MEIQRKTGIQCDKQKLFALKRELLDYEFIFFNTHEIITFDHFTKGGKLIYIEFDTNFGKFNYFIIFKDPLQIEVLSMMMGNVEQALSIYQKRGKHVLSDGKSLFNSRLFSFEPRSFIPTLKLEPEMNPTNQFTPILLASFIDHRVNMWNVDHSLYHRGSDPTIKFDDNNILGNLYRSICKNNSHMDILKLLRLTRQKIYEKTRGEKEREMEEPDENIYDDFF